MLPANRRQQILDRLQEQSIVHIDQLSQDFAVSEMTIHRDLAQLETEGHLRKVRGGAVPITAQQTAPTDACFMCHTTPRSQTQTTIHMIDGSIKRACCPHCGLHGLAMFGDQVASVLVTDFLRGNTVSAQSAAFVVAPEVTICCMPTILAFQKEEDAARFRQGFGGQKMNFAETTHFLHQAMQLPHQHHHEET